MSPNEFVTPVTQGGVGPDGDHCQTPHGLELPADVPLISEPDTPATQPVAEEQQAEGEDDLPALARAHLPRRGRRAGRGKRLVLPADKPEPVSPQQRLLLLDLWQKSGLPAGDFAALVGVSKHTLYAWKKRFDTQGPAGLLDQPRGGPQALQLAWRPVLDLEARTAQAELEVLFTIHGAPLVLKSANGSAFLAASTKSKLGQWQVWPLYSPPGQPGYNGAIEASIGFLKKRTQHVAYLAGHAGDWTTADLDRARELANLVARPRGARGPTPQELWESRRPARMAERATFGACVRQLEEAIRTQDGMAPERRIWTIMSKRRSIVESCSRYSWRADYLPSRGGDFLKPFTVKKWQTFGEGHSLLAIRKIAGIETVKVIATDWE